MILKLCTIFFLILAEPPQLGLQARVVLGAKPLQLGGAVSDKNKQMIRETIFRSELERLRAEYARLQSELAAERSVPVINADTGEAKLEDLGPRWQRRRLEGGAGVSSNSSNTGEERGGGGGESTLARLVEVKTENAENAEQAEELENAQELNQHLVLHGDSKMSEIDTLAARNTELELNHVPVSGGRRKGQDGCVWMGERMCGPPHRATGAVVRLHGGQVPG